MRKASLICLALVLGSGAACRSEVTVPEPQDPHAPHEYTARHGMVVAAHRLAAEAGAAVLERGGNAVDAAVATALALNAAEPFASGIGGGGFMVIYLAKRDKVTVFNYREKAPAAAFPEMFHPDGRFDRNLRRTHGLAVAVPGALAGWTKALETYGTMTLKDVIQGAIAIAEEGFPVSPTFSKINKDEYEKLIVNAGEESCYLNQAFPFEPGDTYRNPALAAFFRKLGERGPGEFYRGETAEQIVEAVQARGGVMTLEDLAAYRPEETEPLRGSFRDLTLYSTPPPSCGGAHLLQLLNILENWPLKEWGHNSAPYLHHLSEAFRFVFADKARYLGDPDFVDVPVDRLISKDYGKHIAAGIRPDTVAGVYPSGEFGEDEREDENTTHLCVVDREGNIVSLTQSINHFFGSGIVPEGTGFLLNNHMDDFSSDPASPNAPGAGKRPVSNMAPMILFRDGKPFLILGSPGGTRIFPSLTQILLNVTQFSMSLDAAIEAPRFFSYSVQGQARDISVEDRIPESVRIFLEGWGHVVTVRESYDKYFGGAQGILLRRDKDLILGAADSRRDGYGAGH